MADDESDAIDSSATNDDEELIEDSITDEQRVAVDFVLSEHIHDNQVIGLGSGAMISYLIERLADKTSAGELEGCQFVPASNVTATECACRGLPTTSWLHPDSLDILVECIDQVDVETPGFPCIFGRGCGPGGQQPQISTMQAIINKVDCFIGILPDERGLSMRLSGMLPVVISADEDVWEECAEEIDDTFLGDATVWRRGANTAGGEVNARGGDEPYVSEECTTILDLHFDEGLKLYGQNAEYSAIVRSIMSTPGAVAVGLLDNRMRFCIVPRKDGLLALDQHLQEIKESDKSSDNSESIS